MATIQQVRDRIRQLVSDGQLTENEIDSLSTDASLQGPIEVEPGVNVQLSELVEQLRANMRPGEPMSLADLSSRLDGFIEQIQQDASQLGIVEDQLTELGDPTTDIDKAKKAELETLREALHTRLSEALSRATQMARTSNRLSDLNTEWYRAAGMDVPDGVGGEQGGGNLTMTAKAQTFGQNGAGQTAGQQGGFQLPPLWKAQTSGPQIPTDAFMKSQALDDFALNSFDEVLRNQQKGRQYMMLFNRLAKFAESGDPMAMYQFCKFITTIVAKDKGKQLIDQGKKMLELQELSRGWTSQLVNTKVDANNPNSSTDFTKMMTQVKGETDSIATAQKLLAQTMEETSVVIETMTGVTKSALDFARRAAQKVVS